MARIIAMHARHMFAIQWVVEQFAHSSLNTQSAQYMSPVRLAKMQLPFRNNCNEPTYILATIANTRPTTIMEEKSAVLRYVLRYVPWYVPTLRMATKYPPMTSAVIIKCVSGTIINIHTNTYVTFANASTPIAPVYKNTSQQKSK